MALYEYYCETCRSQFEQITSSRDPDAGKCPKCLQKNTRKLISNFKVGGRGDLRESTMHGCHEAHVPLGPGSDSHSHGGDSHDEDHSHSHDHNHDHDHGEGHSHDE